ncbi:Transcription factor bHLH [Abeliophyllum distichum]|uniref:Transcription factor bHLH n=1 Tax=Abeliophyllum distichum TaxID=126358 RepID=A0ABD1RT75_9LAMI
MDMDMDLPPPHIFAQETWDIFNALGFSSHGDLVKKERSNVEEEEEEEEDGRQLGNLDLQDEMPFLQMLQDVPQIHNHQIPSSDCRQEQFMFSGQGNLGSKPREHKRKRKRTRTGINKEETENQRMTHIAVERNRRRLMNDHLNSLRSLMPPTYVQRGDQASIIGGAIDFLKELEQLLESLEAQKRLKTGCCDTVPTSKWEVQEEDSIRGDLLTVESKSPSADVQVTVIQNHVNLKIQCMRRHGQLLNAILAFESLKLTVLHLNVTSLDDSLVHYSFSLKVEEDCKMGGSAAEIAGAVHQIFGYINGNGTRPAVQDVRPYETS